MTGPERLDAEAALLARLPQRMVPDLDRIIDLVDLLGSPQRAYQSIHVTGTNGKTSTVRMIDSLLRAFGLTTGRTTSPHLESMRERISLDGEPLTEEQFAAVYAEVEPYARLVDAKHPDDVTFHEMLTAMAFAAFADAPVDVAVVEVGMGGTWDATNVLDGNVAVLTPIGLDHTEWLGDTIAKIATEKAGIIKPGAQVVMSVQPPEAALVIEARALEVGATLVREGFEYGIVSRRQAVGGQLLTLQGLGGTYDDLFLSLQGPHQASNAATALAAVESFLGGGSNGQLDVEAVREGFAAADSPGRLEVVRRNPTVVLDGAHNPAGAQALATAIADGFDFTRLVGVIGVLADKDVRGVLEAMEPILSAIVVTQNASPRAMPAEELGGLADEIFGRDRVEVRRKLDDAIESAISIAEDETEYGGAGVLVFGSLVTVGEARTLLRRR